MCLCVCASGGGRYTFAHVYDEEEYDNVKDQEKIASHTNTPSTQEPSG